MIGRRAFLAATAAGLSGLAAGCARDEGVPGVLRIGFITRLSDVPVMAGLASGRLAAALPGLRIETRVFRAGPRVTEALLGGAIDVGTTGPAPLVATHVRHRGAPLAVVSGMCSGGASLVCLPEIRGPVDLRGRLVATPQIGSTNDVALRTWLARHGEAPTDQGGKVVVEALSPANILAEMRRGGVAAAWLPEPWPTRLVRQLGARRLVDERDLWPERRFPTALVAVRRGFLRTRPGDVGRVVAALGAEVDRAVADPTEAQATAKAELLRLARMDLPVPLLTEAMSYAEFTRDPLARQLSAFAVDVARLGYAPSASVAGLLT